MFDLAKASVEKDNIQQEAVLESARHSNLLLSWATGCSKTRAVLRIIDYFYAHELFIDLFHRPKIYIVLKETNHEQNWKDELKKWGMQDYLPYITFFCYASLHKYIEEYCDILVLDECHALSEMREDYLKTIKCDKIISLSATVNEVVKSRIKSYKPGFYEFHIGLQDAIDRGILPPPTIKVVYIDLDDIEKKYEAQVSQATKKRKGYKPVMVTAKQLYRDIQGKIDMWEKKWLEEKEDWVHTKWIQSMGKRKKIMAMLKTDALKVLLELLKDKRYICFTGSIEQANEVGGQWAVHSKMMYQRREMLIKLFNDGDIDHLYAVGMLRESMNLTDIEVGIISQLDNQSGSFFQMTGRALRSIAPEVYILILRDTKDEDYFAKATKGLSSQYFSDFIWPKA